MCFACSYREFSIGYVDRWYNICIGKYCRAEKSAGVSHTLIENFWSGSPMYLANVRKVCCTSFSPKLSEFFFINCRAESKAKWKKLEQTHSKCMLHPTNRLCGAKIIRAFGTEKKLAQQSTARPQARVDPRMMSVIHNMFLCSEIS